MDAEDSMDKSRLNSWAISDIIRLLKQYESLFVWSVYCAPWREHEDTHR